jgi:hypothetical protein
MKSVLLSTAYFPPVYYFAQIIECSEVIIEREENFHKQTYRNRCVILGANGPLNLTVPVQHDDTKIRMSNLRIAYQNQWSHIHFRAIESAYRNSPFYEYYIDDFKPFFQKEFSSLLEFNSSILSTCLCQLGYKGQIKYTTEFNKKEDNPAFDYRYSISPKITLENRMFPEYHQVFGEKYGFVPNLSILDLIFNVGPESSDYLNSIKKMDRFDSVHS